METFQALTLMLTDMLGPMGPLIGFGGFGAFMLMAAIPLLVGGKKDPLDRIKQESIRMGVGPGGTNSKMVLRDKGGNGRLNKYAAMLTPEDEGQMTEMRQKMMKAGYASRDSVGMFFLVQFGLAVGGLVLGVFYHYVLTDAANATTQQTMTHILGPLVVGYMAPKYWLTKRTGKRQEEITDGFPDALDMMLVCVEAGQSMDQSILRVAMELKASYPALADEFQMVANEVKAGKDKTSVLNDMGERCGVQDVSSFVTVLNQSQTFGTPVADALRVYAAEMRDKRVMRAEEKANKLPTKMTLTTMMLTVPPLLIILVGPSALGITKMGEIGGGNSAQVDLEKNDSDGDL